MQLFVECLSIHICNICIHVLLCVSMLVSAMHIRALQANVTLALSKTLSHF